MPMSQQQVSQFFRTHAPTDVQHTLAWLSSSGYVLVSQEGTNTFGAVFVFEGDCVVQISVDRSQWSLDVAVTPAAAPWQYDLLLAAQSNQEYAQQFPWVGTRPAGAALPKQLPDGVSWRETLPGILRWIQAGDVTESIAAALQQRSALMWPRNR